MNLIPLPVHDRLHLGNPTKFDPATATAIQEFLLLEACMAGCESLADTIASDPEHAGLFDELSECIAACQTYLAAKARESRFANRLLHYCVEAMADTAAACESLPSAASKRCQKLIKAGLRQLQSAHDHAGSARH